MRMVIDSNYLRAPEFDQYLSRTTTNYAVLTDYAAKEAYQLGSTSGILKSMEIACRYPKQIIVLKSTRTICGLNWKGHGLQKRLIDFSQTKDFSYYSRQLTLIKNGHRGLESSLREHHSTAYGEINGLLHDAEAVRGIIGTFSRQYSAQERDAIRAEMTFSNDMRNKFIMHVYSLTKQLLLSHPEVKRLPESETVKNTFLFRLALSMYLLDLWWGTQGGAATAKAETIRNDMVDMYFVAYSTYFDGLLSNDVKPNRILKQVRHHLDHTFV